MKEPDATSIDHPVALNPSIVGQAEKAHAAILSRVLAETTLDEKQWITLNLALAANAPVDRAKLVAHVTGVAKLDQTAVETSVASLAHATLVQLHDHNHHLTVTDQGRALVEELRAEIGQIVGRAYGDTPAEDLVTAARVLSAITARLSEALAAWHRRPTSR